MNKYDCPRCKRSSYSAASFYKTNCIYCGYPIISDVKAVDVVKRDKLEKMRERFNKCYELYGADDLRTKRWDKLVNDESAKIMKRQVAFNEGSH